MESSNNLHSQVRAWEDWQNTVFREREEFVRVIWNTTLSKSNAFAYGPPGTAKTMLLETMSQVFQGANFFDLQFFSFTTPEDLFGPVSMKALEQDDYRRVTQGYFPESHFALLDEVFKGEEGILNGLLWPLSGRKYRNGSQVLDMPLYAAFGASNEIPLQDKALAALYDRFVLRVRVDYIAEEDEFMQLLFDTGVRTPNPPPPLTLSHLDQIVETVRRIPFSSEAREAVRELKRKSLAHGIEVSDRKWVQVFGERHALTGAPLLSAAKAEAWMNGHSEVQKSDLNVAYFAFWRSPDEIEKVTRVVGEVVNRLDVEAQKSLNKAQEIFAQVHSLTQDSNMDVAVRRRLLGDVNDQIKPVQDELETALTGREHAPEAKKLRKALKAVQRMRHVIAQLAGY